MNELREKIVRIIGQLGDEYYIPLNASLKEVTDQILALIKEAGYVRLSQDQSLPELNLPTLSGNRSLEITITSFAKKIRGDMLKASWRKVEL